MTGYNQLLTGHNRLFTCTILYYQPNTLQLCGRYSTARELSRKQGAVWVKRFTDVYSKCIWLNPEPEEVWPYRQSIQIVKELMNNRMYPTTIGGLEKAMKALAK